MVHDFYVHCIQVVGEIEPLFKSGVSTSLPIKYIRSQTIFRHEGWHFGGQKGPSSGFNRF